MQPGRKLSSLHSLFLIVLLWMASHPLSAKSVVQLEIQGAIGPATADYVVRGLQYAEASGAALVVLRIDTPGGLDKSMRTIIQHILKSPVPVAAFVAPGGARAASAGTYILYASHIAAMSPATNLGAATPVQIQPPVSPLPEGEADKTGDKQPSLSAMEKKIVNDAAAYIEGLADLRNRDKTFAIKAVREGASLSAQQALDANVIDIVADNLASLLSQVQGRTVALPEASRVLDVAGASIDHYQPDWRNRFLSVITDPNVAYVLMLVGIYGLIFEFSNPGLGGPGIAGAICILLALYAFQVLPVSYAGLGLIILGLGLMAAEAMVPSIGLLGIGGVVAFVVGSIILMDTELPAYQIALPLILSLAVVAAGSLIILLRLLVRSRQRAVVTGTQSFVGESGVVAQVQGDSTWVRFEGELWQANSSDSLQKGDPVEVLAVDGLHLIVKKSGG